LQLNKTESLATAKPVYGLDPDALEGIGGGMELVISGGVLESEAMAEC